MHVAFEQKMSQQHFVFERGDKLVGFFPLRSFVEGEDAFVGGGVLCREQARLVFGKNRLGKSRSLRGSGSFVFFASLFFVALFVAFFVALSAFGIVFLDGGEKGFFLGRRQNGLLGERERARCQQKREACRNDEKETKQLVKQLVR